MGHELLRPSLVCLQFGLHLIVTIIVDAEILEIGEPPRCMARWQQKAAALQLCLKRGGFILRIGFCLRMKIGALYMRRTMIGNKIQGNSYPAGIWALVRCPQEVSNIDVKPRVRGGF